jgi:hypothetical protein
LLELSEAEAWAGAAAVDQDDEVKQTWNGNYYNARGKRRSLVIQDLAYRRTRISHDLEAARLQRDIASANAYKGIAQAQIGQAQARKAIAEQRVKIAQLQQRFAEENRDFLDMREFSASLWYELAQQAKLIKQRYLDMATEVAFLMSVPTTPRPSAACMSSATTTAAPAPKTCWGPTCCWATSTTSRWII